MTLSWRTGDVGGGQLLKLFGKSGQRQRGGGRGFALSPNVKEQKRTISNSQGSRVSPGVAGVAD